MKIEKVLGIEVSDLNYNQLKNKILSDIQNNKKSTIIAVNPEKIIKARKDSKLKVFINHTATYKIADGIGIILASKLNKGSIKSRITGIDSLEMICELSAEKGYKIFLYGGSKDAVIKTKFELEAKYDNINISGFIDGYEKDEDFIIDTINKCRPNVLFVALGSPKQEFWIAKNLEKLNVNILQGVGGSFDVISGNIKRAPSYMQKLGLEWLYRLLKEPRRIGRQIKIFIFLFYILFERRS